MDRFFEKFRWLLFSLHMLMMALIPVGAIAARLSDYSVRLYHPTAVLIAITALSCLLAVGVFCGIMRDKHTFPTQFLGYLDFAMALLTIAILLDTAPSSLNAGVAALLFISSMMIAASAMDGNFSEWLFGLLCGIPCICCVLAFIVALFTPKTALPYTVYRDVVSPDGVYTAEAKTSLGKNDVYHLESVCVAETDEITENPLFRLYPNVKVVKEKTWANDFVSEAEWLNTHALLIGGMEYPVHGTRTLPVNTGGL